MKLCDIVNVYFSKENIINKNCKVFKNNALIYLQGRYLVNLPTKHKGFTQLSR